MSLLSRIKDAISISTFKPPANSIPPPPVLEDLFRFTTYRYLFNEKQRVWLRLIILTRRTQHSTVRPLIQLEFIAQYREFDVDALKKIACESVGAKSCVSLEKISECAYLLYRGFVELFPIVIG